MPGAFEPAARRGGQGAPRRGAGPLTLGIRAEDVDRRRSGEAGARVHHVENHGVELVVTLKAGETLLKATVPAATQVALDETVPFALNQARVHGFDPASGANTAAG